MKNLTSPSLKDTDKFTFELMDALTSPILTYSQAWADYIPQRLLDLIKPARLVSQLLNEEMATMPEVVTYIMTATLEFPMHGEWVDIYTHCSCIVAEQYWKENHWDKVSAPRELSDYELTQFLNPLRKWIYERRRKILKERMKAEKKARPEPIVVEQELPKQLTLF